MSRSRSRSRSPRSKSSFCDLPSKAASLFIRVISAPFRLGDLLLTKKALGLATLLLLATRGVSTQANTVALSIPGLTPIVPFLDPVAENKHLSLAVLPTAFDGAKDQSLGGSATSKIDYTTTFFGLDFKGDLIRFISYTPEFRVILPYRIAPDRIFSDSNCTHPLMFASNIDIQVNNASNITRIDIHTSRFKFISVGSGNFNEYWVKPYGSQSAYRLEINDTYYFVSSLLETLKTFSIGFWLCINYCEIAGRLTHGPSIMSGLSVGSPLRMMILGTSIFSIPTLILNSLTFSIPDDDASTTLPLLLAEAVWLIIVAMPYLSRGLSVVAQFWLARIWHRYPPRINAGANVAWQRANHLVMQINRRLFSFRDYGRDIHLAERGMNPPAAEDHVIEVDLADEAPAAVLPADEGEAVVISTLDVTLYASRTASPTEVDAIAAQGRDLEYGAVD